MLRSREARAALFVLALSLVSIPAALAQCSICTNGTSTAIMAPEPIVMDDQLTWGAGAMSDALGADVCFNGDVVEISRGNNVLQFQPGNDQGMLNGKPVQFSVEPFAFNGRIFVPVCDVVAAFGGTASWDPNARTLSIVTSGQDTVATGFENPQPASLQATATAAAGDDPPGDPPGDRRGPARVGRVGGFRQIPTGFRDRDDLRMGDRDDLRFRDRDDFRFRDRDGYRFRDRDDFDFPFFLNFGSPYYNYPYSYPYSYPYNSPYPYCDAYGNCYYPPAYRNPRLNVVIPLHF